MSQDDWSLVRMGQNASISGVAVWGSYHRWFVTVRTQTSANGASHRCRVGIPISQSEAGVIFDLLLARSSGGSNYRTVRLVRSVRVPHVRRISVSNDDSRPGAAPRDS